MLLFWEFGNIRAPQHRNRRNKEHVLRYCRFRIPFTIFRLRSKSVCVDLQEESFIRFAEESSYFLPFSLAVLYCTVLWRTFDPIGKATPGETIPVTKQQRLTPPDLCFHSFIFTQILSTSDSERSLGKSGEIPPRRP